MYLHRPKKSPLFLVDLVLDVTGVHYSTPLENFETSIITLFDKGILSTHNVPQLDKARQDTMHSNILTIYLNYSNEVRIDLLHTSAVYDDGFLCLSVCDAEDVHQWHSSVGVSGSVGACGGRAEGEGPCRPASGCHPTPGLRPRV